MSQQFTWPEGEDLLYLRPPKEEYHGKLPTFYPPEMFPELNLLKENWKGIRDEIIAYEQKYGNLSKMDSYSPAETKGTWSLTYLMSFMAKLHKVRAKFPLISSLVDQIPTCVTVNISILYPNSEIKPHYGDTNGVIRAHLGLIVPDPYPTIGIKVGEDERGWEEGELLLFTIVNRHSVWSKSPKKRYVLFIDFIPKILEKRQMEICSKTLGSQTFIFFYKRIALFRILPESVADFLCACFALMWRILLPIQRRAKFLSPV